MIYNFIFSVCTSSFIFSVFTSGFIFSVFTSGFIFSVFNSSLYCVCLLPVHNKCLLPVLYLVCLLPVLYLEFTFSFIETTVFSVFTSGFLFGVYLFIHRHFCIQCIYFRFSIRSLPFHLQKLLYLVCLHPVFYSESTFSFIETSVFMNCPGIQHLHGWVNIYIFYIYIHVYKHTVITSKYGIGIRHNSNP